MAFLKIYRKTNVFNILQDPTTECFGRAVSKFNIQKEDMIQFNEGAMIKDIETDTYWHNWWRGTGPDGKRGLFPSSHVQIITELQVSMTYVGYSEIGALFEVAKIGKKDVI